MKLLSIAFVVLISATQTHAASGDVAIHYEHPVGGWLIVFFMFCVAGLLITSTAHKKYGEKGESRREFAKRLRKSGRRDIPSD